MRYAIHDVDVNTAGGRPEPSRHFRKMVAATNSGRRAKHLASEYARCHPGRGALVIDRATVHLETWSPSNLYYRAPENPAVEIFRV